MSFKAHSLVWGLATLGCLGIVGLFVWWQIDPRRDILALRMCTCIAPVVGLVLGIVLLAASAHESSDRKALIAGLIVCLLCTLGYIFIYVGAALVPNE